MATTSALSRLKKAANLTPVKRTVKLNDGTDFEFYSAPLTMSERERAQKMPGGDDPNGFALNLLITKAVDDAGQRLFAAGEIAELKNEVMDADLQQLMLAIITNPEEVEVDMKSIKIFSINVASLMGNFNAVPKQAQLILFLSNKKLLFSINSLCFHIWPLDKIVIF